MTFEGTSKRFCVITFPPSYFYVRGPNPFIRDTRYDQTHMTGLMIIYVYRLNRITMKRNATEKKTKTEYVKKGRKKNGNFVS